MQFANHTKIRKTALHQFAKAKNMVFETENTKRNVCKTLKGYNSLRKGLHKGLQKGYNFLYWKNPKGYNYY